MPICEICGSKDFKLIATEIREGESRICQCQQCDLVIQDLTMSQSEIDNYYNSEYRVTNSLETGKMLDARVHFENRLKNVHHLMECIQPYLKKDQRVLDIGCGAGDWLYAMKPFVRDVVGVELAKEFVDFMNNELGIRAYAQDVNEIDFGDEKFDLIVSHGAIDHMPNPKQTLQTIKKLLAKDGMAYLMVPNRNEAMNFYLPEPNRTKFNKFFWHKAHFFYFTAETFRKLLDKTGFDCEISCRHQYSLQNFLHWYYRGEPQKSFASAALTKGLFSGESAFEKEMNAMFESMDTKFHEILERNMGGDMLCCVVRHKK